ncbi:S1 family peptidase [Roseovarius aestuarii]|uniref:Serine protease n=1 Tax=Roseovarius aestuarii TaxID=475083 RepID=A0A1X7BUW1_9RHOB|nr:serine protease [Roseovarius aestuarii]SMC13315.1 hypothetical protein ROA7745_03161 [Roseovarius aestuarii]
MKHNFEIPHEFEHDNLSNWGFHVAQALANHPRTLLEEHAPSLVGLSDLRAQIHHVFYLHSEREFLVKVRYSPELQIHTGGNAKGGELEFFSKNFERLRASTKNGLVVSPQDGLTDASTMTFIGQRDSNFADWGSMQKAAAFWLNEYCVPHLLKQNRERVQLALPQPPIFQIQDISRSLWVLECEESSTQGTAFHLSGVGLITCAHSIGPKTRAFRHDSPSERFVVKRLSVNEIIDLAVCEIDFPNPSFLEKGSGDSISYHDHLLVAGHPNFRHGDTPVASPGIAVGFRTVSSIRRILTNAPIVAGMSGGPALGKDGKVVGVCVTGLEKLGGKDETEDSAVIPIDAIGFVI